MKGDSMLADSRIVYLFVYVSDIRASRRFYEDKLGLRLLSVDEDSAMFDCGTCILALQTAGKYNVDLPVKRDNSTDVVWMVDDMEAMQRSLEARGVQFIAPVWYEVGGIVDFYDPDMHWLTLYQPSEQSLEWPSGGRIAAVRAARRGGNGGTRAGGAAAGNGGGTAVAAPRATEIGDLTLRDAELIYAFFFVPNAEDTERFYHDDLGLRDIEGGPCSRSTDNDEEGVIKYDTGGIMLTTHFYDQTRTPAEVEEHGCPPRILDLERMKGVAPAFHVSDVRHTVRALQQRRPDFKPRITKSEVGVVATCEDPGGHMFFLWEPSEAALVGQVGEKVQAILAMPL
jgi:catechol 2,3-dioxygenase-like lactoylglutathione lyase family enzyme